MDTALHDGADPTSGSSGSISLEDQFANVTIQDTQAPNGATTAAASAASAGAKAAKAEDITYRNYKDEDDIDVITALVAPSLSEPYSVYCYRYFLHGWPQLCILAYHDNLPVGVIVCKQDRHRGKLIRGYIAMLSTHPLYRKLGIATTLVEKAIRTMKQEGAQEIVLETEVSNKGALSLYQRLGFIRLKRLHRFYLNSSDAFRLVLPVPEDEWQEPPPGTYDEENRPRTPVEMRPPQAD
ncbi:acyl-CoA N-acyltransferase [Cystobasidium minutum MCA 4210]|uniref:acyl-CoA N-acyltransferase n=1 Tax=Cystobasidium minutum MCA 4210 TaxID=1397322 RepID=UPI0034CE5578|eukprot:jgi/Rhomi1/38949/CE38948_395